MFKRLFRILALTICLTGVLIVAAFALQAKTNDINENNVEYQTNIQSNTQHVSPVLSSYANSFNGKLTWKDYDGNVHPLQFIKVEISENSIILEIIYTDVKGNFYSQANLPELINIRIYAAGLKNGNTSNITVIKQEGTEIYWEDSNVSSLSAFNYQFNAQTSNSPYTDRAMQIAQAAITAARYAKEMNGDFLTDVKIKYQYYDSCVYYGGTLGEGDGTIIIETDKNMERLASYNSWDTVMHEYGHHVQYQPDVNIFQNTSGSRYHDFGVNLIDKYHYTKEHAIALAWREAWPTLFASMAQQYFVFKGELDNTINTVGDAAYDSYSGSNIVFANARRLGEASEDGILGVLWALYSTVDKSYDKIPPLGHQAMWDLIVGNNLSVDTFSEFAFAFGVKYPEYKSEFGHLLSYFGMASCDIEVLEFTENTPPTLNWLVNIAGIDSLTVNNRFGIIIYNVNNEVVLRNLGITVRIKEPYSLIRYYTLSIDDWADILNMNYSTVKIAIVAEQTSLPITGAYISELITIYTPARFKTTSVSGGVSIIGLKSDVIGSLDIPEIINDQKVISIANLAFANQSGIFQITIPSTVTKIGDYAFANCKKLEVINYNATNCADLTIDSNVFYNSGSGTMFNPNAGTIEINIGQGVKRIPKYLFYGMTNVRDVRISESVLEIGDFAFANFTNNDGTSLYFNAIRCNDFQENNNIFTYSYGVSVVFGNKVERIPANFSYSISASFLYLTKIPNSVNSIGANAFVQKNGNYIGAYIDGWLISYDDSHVLGFGFEANTRGIADQALKNQTDITYLAIPAGIPIGDRAFEGCSNLTIYTAETAKPNYWKTSWNSSNRPVIWGCELALDPYYKTTVTAFSKTPTSISNPNATGGINNPYESDRFFGGWYDNEAFAGVSVEISAMKNGQVYYVKWARSRVFVSYGDVGGGNYSGTWGNLPYLHEFGTAVDLPSPTKEGHHFRGWYTNIDGTGNPITFLSASGYTSNITLYAKWEKFAENGDGSQVNPFKISTAEQLDTIVRTHSGSNFILTNDIVLNDTTNCENWDINPPSKKWTPIGTLSSPFSGVFNGNGYAIIGLYVSTYEAYGGLFGYVNGGIIINLGVEDSFVRSKIDTGIIAARVDNGIVANCYNIGVIYASNGCGIVGLSSMSRITNNYTTVKNQPDKDFAQINFTNVLFNECGHFSSPIIIGGLEAKTLAEAFNMSINTIDCMPELPAGMTYSQWYGFSYPKFRTDPTFFSEGLSFYLINGGTEYEVSRGRASGVIVIPSTYKGLPVTKISGGFAYSNIVTMLVIPSSIRWVISSNTFKSCTSLKYVYFLEDSRIKSIGAEAFKGCTSLISVSLPSSLTDICSSAFESCTSLVNVSFGVNSKLNVIGKYAFKNCIGLTNINIPNGVNCIVEDAFEGCINLFV